MTRRFVITAICAVAFLASCAELSARRKVQKADKLYADGKYTEAIALYEEALADEELPTAHHNLGVAAYVAFQPGMETPENLEFAQKASLHFQAYLESHPDEQEIVELLTTVWLNSDQVDLAIAYWEAKRKESPQDSKPLRKLRSIQVQAGNYEEALKWDYARVDLATDPKEKVLVLSQIGSLQLKRVTNKKIVDFERLQIADSGISALLDALTLQPDNAKLHSLLASLYQFRALAHETGWARLADDASQRLHHSKRKALADAEKAAAEAAAKTQAKPKGAK